MNKGQTERQPRKTTGEASFLLALYPCTNNAQEVQKAIDILGECVYNKEKGKGH